MEAQMNSLSPSKVLAFWRSKLNEYLTSTRILTEIDFGKRNGFVFKALEWEEYWHEGAMSQQAKKLLAKLKTDWLEYIRSGFAKKHASDYCDSYLRLLEFAIIEQNRDLTAKLVSFENICFTCSDYDFPPAALTTNFRNPIFLYLSPHGYRKHDKQDSRLLPLITVLHKGSPWLFYCLIKERLIKHSDLNLLIYLNAHPAERSPCFNFYHSMENILFPESGQYFEQRSRRIAKKVIKPLLEKEPGFRTNGKNIKILDLGSGDGHLLSNILADLVASLNAPVRFQATLLDGISIDPKNNFQSPSLMPYLSQLDYIRSDYREYLDLAGNHNHYDFVFLFKTLHNMSKFGIIGCPSSQTSPSFSREESNYYNAQAMLLNQDYPHATAKDDLIYKPQRKFNPCSLETTSGKSIFEKFAQLSDWTVIEDFDLAHDSIIEHLKASRLKEPIFISDLSRLLGLRTNHIYCLCSHERKLPERGSLIWPN
jgi:hypothetical protein